MKRVLKKLNNSQSSYELIATFYLLVIVVCTSSCSFTVTVIPQCCLANPILTCPAYFSACPDSEIDPATTGRATAEPGSQYCAKPLISFKDDTLINALCSLTIARTWTAWDPNKPELRSSCIQTIELKDLTPPTIVCPQNITVSSEPDCLARPPKQVYL